VDRAGNRVRRLGRRLALSRVLQTGHMHPRVEPVSWSLPGHAGELACLTWPNPDARCLAVVLHGYGEHLGRYHRVADALVAAGAVVVGQDMAGHGRSAGERALTPDFETVVDDVATMAAQVGDGYAGLPVVLVGHAVGAMIAIRYAQRFPDRVAALVLSAPVLGNWQTLDLLSDEEIPDVPLDPALLSTDPAAGADYLTDPLVWHGPFRRTTLAAIEECLSTIDFDHPLGDELPALWLHGVDDELAPMADTRAGMDRVRGLLFEERIYPGVRHDLFHETTTDQVLADVTEFVTRVVQDAGSSVS
jgi:alpha-beta hydrolase superfamily lysophospholipase